MLDTDTLTALIYDAALAPGAWLRVLERVSDAVGGGATALLMQNQVTKGGSGLTARLDPRALLDYYGAFAGRNPLLRKNDLSKLQDPQLLGVSTDQDVLSKEEFVRTPFYNEFSKPNGMHSALMLALLVQGDSVATFNVMRPHTKGDFDRAEIATARRLRLHLGRALELTLRLSEARATESTLDGFLDRSAQSVFLLDGQGMVIRANRSAEQLLSRRAGLSVERRVLHADVIHTDRQLQRLIASAVRERCGGSLVMPRSGEGRPLSILVTPVGKLSADLFDAGPRALVCVSDPGAKVAPPEEGLREMFNLTPAEARVALELLAGHGTRAIAERLGIARNTVRVHLSRILEKTRTNRQAELVRVLMRSTGMYTD